MIHRFSSRRTNLGQSFLNPKLQGAQSYNRIAGYFRSSILEIAGEALESMTGTIRVVCNSDVSLKDVETARAANYAIRREWCASNPEKYGHLAQPRFARLYEFLKSGKMQVKVLPREKFGLVHGKAGVITLALGNPCLPSRIRLVGASEIFRQTRLRCPSNFSWSEVYLSRSSGVG